MKTDLTFNFVLSSSAIDQARSVQCPHWDQLSMKSNMFGFRSYSHMKFYKTYKTNKTKYFRLQSYDKVWLLSWSVSTLWVLSACLLSAVRVLSDFLLNALWMLYWSHPEVILKSSWSYYKESKPKRWRLRASDKFGPDWQMHRCTEIVTSWAPVGAKKDWIGLAW